MPKRKGDGQTKLLAGRGIRWPPPVHPGDRIGVAALSGPVDAERLDIGMDALRALGYEPVAASNLRSRCGLFAGDDDERLGAFHALADDPDIGAIVFARGGHGLLRLLPRLDWRRLARRPRAYVGYSDLTPFLHQVVERLGLVAFHGPMVAGDLARGLDGAESNAFRQTLSGRAPLALPLAGAQGGACEGRLAGGCLSLMTAMLGTPYAPDLRDTLLVLEDVDEPAYRLDRMLTHLDLSGTLKAVRGWIFGHLTRGETSDVAAWSELLEDHASRLGRPVAWGAPVGHSAPNHMLPIGAWARLDPDRLRLDIEVPEPRPSLEATSSIRPPRG